MVRFGIPGQNVNGLAYADDRLSTVPMVQAPRRPTVNDKKFPMWTEWRVTKNAVLPAVEGEFWKLIRFESNGDATWVMIGGGSTGPAVNFETDDGSPNVVPDGLGEIRILGGVGINVTGQGPGNTITIALTGGGAAIDTLTGDSGGAVSADGSGNINIVGGPGVTIRGDAGTNTLTVNSVLYTDQGVSTSVTSDSGSFSTAAITLTLPASPNNGERCEFIATNGILTIQAAGTQVIHLGGDSSSAGGACTGSSTGDSITLIYQSSTDDWWSLSANGVWVLT